LFVPPPSKRRHANKTRLLNFLIFMIDYRPTSPYGDKYAQKNPYENPQQKAYGSYGSYNNAPMVDRRPEAYLTPERTHSHDVQSAPRKPVANDYFHGSEMAGSIKKVPTREDQMRDYNNSVRKNSTSPSPPHRQIPKYDHEPPRLPNPSNPYQPKVSDNYRKQDNSSHEAKGWFDDG
jgi:hypothetical protein